jgi:hypothetical protein
MDQGHAWRNRRHAGIVSILHFRRTEKEIAMNLGTHEKTMSQAIDAAMECMRACEKCAIACLEEKDVEMLRECIRLDRDCAAICELTARYMISESRFHAQACQLCSEICEACAAECDRHADMAHCRDCAAACRKCSEACLDMIEAMV